MTGAGADRRVVPFGLPQADIAQRKLTDTKIKYAPPLSPLCAEVPSHAHSHIYRLSQTWNKANRPLKLSWKKSSSSKSDF